MADSWAEIEADVQRRVRIAVTECKTKSQRCAVRAANELRNAELEILRGGRSGRTYRVPGTKATYTASAPGEPPAVRTGALRMSFGMTATGNNGSYTAEIHTDVPYANYLEEGTSRMAARPFKEKIIEKAKPKVMQIFSELTK